MSYGLGFKALRSLCVGQDPLEWYRSKLATELFKPNEHQAFQWVADHLKAHHVLPKIETLVQHFPDIQQVEAPEPPSYYVKLLESKYYYECINQANLNSQQILKANQDDHEKALDVLRQAESKILMQKYRHRLLDVGKEAAAMVIKHYHDVQLGQDSIAMFGWPYMDDSTKGILPGEIVSIVGRPAAGKTWLTLWTAMENWRGQGNVLFVSMEMMLLPIAQRISALYTGCNIQQLKTAGFSSETYKKFVTGMKLLVTEKGKFYVIDGNLAASVEDIFALADMLECDKIVIDGGYLVRHRNAKLDRFNRVAENVEMMKRFSGDLGAATICSWQLNREASKKEKKGGAQGQTSEAGLEDIGYSDAIGQISSIVLGLFQEEGVETMKKRTVRVMKGRDGQIGQFGINWDFWGMDFAQCDPPVQGEQKKQEELQYV